MNRLQSPAIVRSPPACDPLPPPPTREGSTPQMPIIPPPQRPRARTTIAFAIAAGITTLLVGACATDDGNQVTAPTVLGMPSTIAPAYDDGEDQLFQVQRPVQLPVRKPTSEEENALGSSTTYPHAPYLLNTDERIEIHFTISNLDNAQHTVELLVDPWNEFDRYKPSIVVTDEALIPSFSGYDRFFVVPAMGRITGTLTTDDTNELEVDLATVMNITKNPPSDPNFDMAGFFNHVFNLQNRSNDGDPLVTPYIPSVIAGLTGFDLGLRTSEAANVAVEISIDLTDLNGNRILPAGTTTGEIGIPPTVLETPASSGDD
jgi:hypothetical protein